MDPFSNATKIEERIVALATTKGIPLGGSFELLPLCNMNCRMCFLRLSPAEMNAQGRLRTAKEWITLGEEAKEAGLLFLLLTGGEPFLHPEFREIYEGLAKLGFYITLNSNGTLITEEYADMLARHLPRRVNVTLYGSSDEIYGKLCGNPHGFSQTMNGIQLLKERNVPMKLNGSLTPDNWEDLEQIQRIAKELEIPLEVDAYMFPSSRKAVCQFQSEARLSPKQAAEGYLKIWKNEYGEEELLRRAKVMTEYQKKMTDLEGEQEKEHLPCRAGRSSFWITWKGVMTPCVFMDKPGVPVFEQGFQKSWEQIREAREEIFLPTECTKCGKRKFCTVCGACAYTETGSFEKKPEYMCALTEEKFRLMENIVAEQEKE